MPKNAPLPYCTVSFHGEPYPLPDNCISSEFCRTANGSYQLDYTVAEQAAASSRLLLTGRKRTVKTTIFLTPDGVEQARCVVEGEWEADNPSLGSILTDTDKRLIHAR